MGEREHFTVIVYSVGNICEDDNGETSSTPKRPVPRSRRRRRKSVTPTTDVAQVGVASDHNDMSDDESVVYWIVDKQPQDKDQRENNIQSDVD